MYVYYMFPLHTRKLVVIVHEPYIYTYINTNDENVVCNEPRSTTTDDCIQAERRLMRISG